MTVTMAVRNAISSALPLFLFSQVNMSEEFHDTFTSPQRCFFRSRRNAGWNVEMTHAVCAAAEQKRFANIGANTPYPFPFIVPSATD